MTENQSRQHKLAERLDQIIPPGRTNPLLDDENPLVSAALRLAHAPYPALASPKRDQILSQVLAAHQARMGDGKSSQSPSPRYSPTAAVGTVLPIALAAAILILIVNAWLGQNNSELSAPPPGTLTTTTTNTPTATSTPSDTPTAIPPETTSETTPETTLEITPEVTPETTGDDDAGGDFDCEHPGNYCNSQGTPGGVERGGGRGNNNRP